MRRHSPRSEKLASITELNGKWRAQVYVRGSRDSKVFDTADEAKDWADLTEGKLRERAQALSVFSSSAFKFPASVLKAALESPMTHTEIIDRAIPTAILSGIYFLIRNQRVVYVGQSVNVLRRISEHIKNGARFDSFTISLCKRNEMDRLETTYIRALFPDENIVFGRVMNKRKRRVA